jgi:hypothetical protein
LATDEIRTPVKSGFKYDDIVHRLSPTQARPVASHSMKGSSECNRY